MTELFRPPLRTLSFAVIYMMVIFVLATVGYMAVGWSFGDALYMVVLTIYTVGYDEVHPIATPLLRCDTSARRRLAAPRRCACKAHAPDEKINK